MHLLCSVVQWTEPCGFPAANSIPIGVPGRGGEAQQLLLWFVSHELHRVQESLRYQVLPARLGRRLAKVWRLTSVREPERNGCSVETAVALTNETNEAQEGQVRPSAGNSQALWAPRTACRHSHQDINRLALAELSPY